MIIIEKIRATPFIHIVITHCFISAISAGGKTVLAPSPSQSAVFGQKTAFLGPALWIIWKFFVKRRRRGDPEQGVRFRGQFLAPTQAAGRNLRPYGRGHLPYESALLPYDRAD